MTDVLSLLLVAAILFIPFDMNGIAAFILIVPIFGASLLTVGRGRIGKRKVLRNHGRRNQAAQ